MSENTKIEWCDSTFNPWIGCTKVSPGCDHCYAEKLNNRFNGGNWGPAAPRKRTHESNWKQPINWNKKAAAGLFVECAQCGKREFRKWDNTLPPGGLSFCSSPDCASLPESDSSTARPRVFCASMADWLDNEVPVEWLADLLDLIRVTPHLDWLLLSKRVGNWGSRLKDVIRYDARAELINFVAHWRDGNAPKNIWLGITVVNQTEADRDIPKLLAIPAAIHFLSIEPMQAEIDPTRINGCPRDARYTDGQTLDALRCTNTGNIDWIICGGESGPGARPMHPDWVRSLRDQCVSAGTAFFFKQWGEWADVDNGPKADSAYDDKPECWAHIEGGHHTGGMGVDFFNMHPMYRVGKKKAGRLLDGAEWNQFPRS